MYTRHHAQQEVLNIDDLDVMMNDDEKIVSAVCWELGGLMMDDWTAKLWFVLSLLIPT